MDHPHARGENYTITPTLAGYTGPSPRTWGELHDGQSSVFRSADHPHARGENFFLRLGLASSQGPSPRTWGERQIRASHRKRFRTIPTHVGSTMAEPIMATLGTDHPHARGENCVTPLAVGDGGGPSPRTWGELGRRASPAARARTIPTHVGRTFGSTLSGTKFADHPHARGENVIPHRLPRLQHGPSPRMWGERHRSAPLGFLRRTIPTHVGRTKQWAILAAGREDHPHACGENRMPIRSASAESGPSPRTWGERSSGREQGQATRTIPTHVGRTPSERRRLWKREDHPHACGENKMRDLAVGEGGGPSPRMWGELCLSNNLAQISVTKSVIERTMFLSPPISLRPSRGR